MVIALVGKSGNWLWQEFFVVFKRYEPRYGRYFNKKTFVKPS
jgi:hypothetical protein